MKKFWQDFKKFALKGNVFDMAVGVVVGGAFGKIVSSLVSDVLMPLLSLLTGGVHVGGLFVALGDGTFTTAADAAEAGVATLNYGAFLQSVIDFFLIALSIFFAIKLIAKLHKKAEVAAPPKRLCPYCLQQVDEKATRCPHCTSELPEPEKPAAAAATK